MASSEKNYVVRYDIAANVENAIKGLEKLQGVVDSIAKPIEKVADDIAKMASSMKLFKENAAFKIEPSIDVTGFNKKLDQMVTNVETAASKMHSAIYNAMNGNNAGKKAIQKGAKSAWDGKSSAEELKAQIKKYEKELEELNRRSGSKTKKEVATTANSIKQDIQNAKAQLAEVEKVNRQIAAQRVKTATVATQKPVVRQKAEPFKQTNITPKVIKEWERVFGNAKSKSLTINIKGKADGPNGAIEVINRVKKSLGELKELGIFDIIPRVNSSGFKDAENRLKSMAKLSEAISMPFTTQGKTTEEARKLALTQEEQKKLLAAQKNVERLKGNISKVQDRLNTNRERIKKEPNATGLKGRITQDEKLLNKYTQSRVEQEGIVSTLQNRAQAASVSQKAGAATVDLVGNISKLNVTKEFTIPVIGELTKILNKVKEAIPVKIRVMSDQVTEAIRAIPRPTLTVNVKANTESLQEQILSESKQSKGKGKKGSKGQATAGKAKIVSQQETVVKAVLDTSGIAEQLKAIPRLTVPVNMKLGWENGAVGKNKQLKGISEKIPSVILKLDPTQAQATLKAFISEIKAYSPQNINLTATGTPTAAGGNKSAATASGTIGNQPNRKGVRNALNPEVERQIASQRARINNSLVPYIQNQGDLGVLQKYHRYFNRAADKLGIERTPAMLNMPQNDLLRYLNEVSAQMQAAKVSVPAQLQSRINKLTAQANKAESWSSAPTRPRTPSQPRYMRRDSFYDVSRKWSYPFTGNTSFGATTPMAVDMAKGMGITYAIGGAMSMISEAFKESADYQHIMATTNAILKNGTDTYSVGGFRNMEKTVRDVGVETKFTAPQVASAAKFLAMAGYDIPAINAAIRPISDLAIIGDNDLGEVADKLTNIMTTFKIKPEQMRGVANIMTNTMIRSNTDLMMLAEAAKYGGGVAYMYNHNDKNLLADTMALFGVMGNSGIQASSAGTALRMMYQNIFKPNKGQKKVLDILKKNDISTKNQDGSNRSMAEIISDIAAKVPQKSMGDLVGNLFRITAQPGANAAIMGAAKEDNTNPDEVKAGLNAVADFVDKNGMSTLAKLMITNRESVNGNISETIANEKKFTIEGLWDQVTSAFTEGITKAFENRQGDFVKMLMELNDYLSKPETVQMLQNLLDMLIEIGKVLMSFVKFWMGVYSTFPGIITKWVKWQMIFTQIGSAVSPVVSLIGAFTRLKEFIVGVDTAISALITKNIAAKYGRNKNIAVPTGVISAAAEAAAGGSPTVEAAQNVQSKAKDIVESAATQTVQSAVENAAERAANVAFIRDKAESLYRGKTKRSSSKNRKAAWELLNEAKIARSNGDQDLQRKRLLEALAARRAAAIQTRANRIYGTRAKMSRAFNAGRAVDFAFLASSLGGIKKMLQGFVVGFAKALGLLISPLGLATIGVTALGVAIWKYYKWLKGDTPDQIKKTNEIEKAAETSRQAQEEALKNRNNLYAAHVPTPSNVDASISAPIGTAKRYADSQKIKNRNKAYALALTDITSNATPKNTDDMVAKWDKYMVPNAINRIALGNDYINYSGKNILKDPKMDAKRIKDSSAMDILTQSRTPMVSSLSTYYSAENVQKNMAEASLMQAGALDEKVVAAQKEIIELRKQYLKGTINKNDYEEKAKDIIGKTVNPNRKDIKTEIPSPDILKLPNTDWSQYKKYQEGGYNTLYAEYTGQIGTLTGKFNAENTLKHGAKAWTDKWWDAIAHITGTFNGIWSEAGKTVNYAVSVMPNGQINLNDIYKQILAKIDNFKLTLQKFSAMSSNIYSMLASLGLVDSSYAGFIKYNKEQNKHRVISAETAGQYWEDYVKNNKAWAGVSKDTYVDWVTTQKTKKLNVNGREVINANERQNMRGMIATTAAINQKKKFDKTKEQADKLAGNTGNNSTNNPTKGNNPGSNNPSMDFNTDNDKKNKQDKYASTYNRQAARPTQIVINVDKLANFDRTMIASSAEERDMITAMEGRITEAVYRIFAEAANSANHVMDRT